MKTSGELAERFRAAGLRITPQREAIFRALAGSEVHPTAEAIWDAVREELPGVSLKTVYETLHELVALGEIQRIDLAPGARKYDPNVEEHHHLVCSVCGDVQDLHADFSHLALPTDQGRGFAVVNAEVIFRGLCANCQGASK